MRHKQEENTSLHVAEQEVGRPEACRQRISDLTNAAAS